MYLREGMKQGDPLAIVTYGIGVILLIKLPKDKFTDITQPRYTDDVGAFGMFTNIELYLDFLKLFILGHGYYPGPPKRVLIVHPENLEPGKRFGLSHGFKVCTGTHYLGGLSGMTSPNVIG